MKNINGIIYDIFYEGGMYDRAYALMDKCHEDLPEEYPIDIPGRFHNGITTIYFEVSPNYQVL